MKNYLTFLIRHKTCFSKDSEKRSALKLRIQNLTDFDFSIHHQKFHSISFSSIHFKKSLRKNFNIFTSFFKYNILPLYETILFMTTVHVSAYCVFSTLFTLVNSVVLWLPYKVVCITSHKAILNVAPFISKKNTNTFYKVNKATL